MCLLMMKPSGVVYNHELLLRAIESGLVTNKDGIGGAVRKSSSNILRMNKGHFNHSKNDSNVVSVEGNRNSSVGHNGRSIRTPTIMGLNLRHNFGL